MVRGTTPIITFRFASDYSGSSEIELTFSQGGNVVIVFEKAQMTFGTSTVGNDTFYTIQITMTQEQANLFSAAKMAEVQFRFKRGSSVTATSIKRLDVDRILNDEVL